MVNIREGDEPQKVPLVYYDEDGNRTVVGEAAVQIKNGEVIALGQLISAGPAISGIGEISFGSEHTYKPSPVEEASARLGILRKSRSEHITQRNPSGSLKICERTNIHAPHEWHIHPADFFAVYCPGKSKK